MIFVTHHVCVWYCWLHWPCNMRYFSLLLRHGYLLLLLAVENSSFSPNILVKEKHSVWRTTRAQAVCVQITMSIFFKSKLIFITPFRMRNESKSKGSQNKYFYYHYIEFYMWRNYHLVFFSFSLSLLSLFPPLHQYFTLFSSKHVRTCFLYWSPFYRLSPMFISSVRSKLFDWYCGQRQQPLFSSMFTPSH